MTSSNEDQDASESYISRTQKKNDDHALQEIGERLTGLSKDRFGRIDLPEELREAVTLARNTVLGGARNRQVKHIASLLRQMDTAPIEEAIENITHGDHARKFAFKKLEIWRDQLRAGDMTPIDEILAACPSADRRQLTQLARNARKEAEGDKSVKASRALPGRRARTLW